MLAHQGASRLTQHQCGGLPWVASHGPISAPLEVEAQLQNELVSVISPSLSSKQQTMSTLTRVCSLGFTASLFQAARSANVPRQAPPTVCSVHSLLTTH